jgi:hypothetical protein
VFVSQAATSRSSVIRSEMRRSRHCPAIVLNSVSATFSQFPCSHVWRISSLCANRCASAGANAS